MLAAQILSMLGFATYSALLPGLRDAWQLSNSEAGLIGGMFFGGYVVTVTWWTSLTDRMDGRHVYLAGTLTAAAGAVGFGLLAGGFWSATLFHALLGAGVAGTYMPGLRLLSDRVEGATQSRYVAFYTSFFGVGAALSIAITGAVAAAFGWRASFVVCAAGPLVAGLLVVFGLPAAGAAPVAASRATFAALRNVFRNRAAVGYILGYTVHCIELFGSRAWMVAFLGYSAGLQAAGSDPWSATAIAALVNLLAVPSSIVGNEIALKIGRLRWIVIAMAISGALGIVLGVSASMHWLLVAALLTVYSLMVMADSATLTAGLIASARAEERGATMGVYSLLGFCGGMLGPALFGGTLDLSGGAASIAAWTIAYAAIGAGGLLAIPFLRIAARRSKP
jgi:MFS family permease